MSKIALVTGASSGIGLSSSIALAQNGFNVVATMRNLDKAGPLRARAKDVGVEIEIAQLDVCNAESIAACVKQVLDRHKRIDLLLNNAGSGYVGTVETTPIADVQRVMDVNFHGVWRTTQAVLPHMRGNKSGRILSISSVGGVLAQPFNAAYCAAKFAVEGMMESLAPEARRFGVHIVLVEPGPVASEFVANADQKTATQMPGAYGELFANYMAATKKVFEGAQTPDDVAKVIVAAATADKPHLRYQTSPALSALLGKKLSDVTGEAGIALTGSRL